MTNVPVLVGTSEAILLLSPQLPAPRAEATELGLTAPTVPFQFVPFQFIPQSPGAAKRVSLGDCDSRDSGDESGGWENDGRKRGDFRDLN